MNQTSNKIISHGSIYLLGNILRRAVSFIMLPIYTRYLTTEDYGTIELLSMIIDFVGIIVGLRVSEGIFRFYGHYKNKKDKNQVIITALIMILILSLIGFIIIALLRYPLSHLAFGNAKYPYPHFILLFSITIVFQGLIEVPMVFIKNLQLPWHFIFFSTFKLFLQLGLNIYLVVIQQMGVKGVIYSALISGGGMSLILAWYTISKTGISFSKTKAKELINFSIPMILTSLIAFYITFGDRYFLRYFNGLSEVGIYSLGYKFGFLLMFIVVNPFSNIWNSEKYNIYKMPDAKKTYQNVFLAFSLILIIASVGISIFIKDLLMIMSAKEFWSAYQIVPIILLAYLFNAWVSFCNLGILVSNNTIEITYGTLIAAILTTIGYFFLIPRFGAMGAAWATVIAFASRFVWVSLKATKYYNMELPWLKALYLLGYAAITISFNWIITSSEKSIFISIYLHLILFIAFLGGLVVLPILPFEWRKHIITNTLTPWRLVTVPLKNKKIYNERF